MKAYQAYLTSSGHIRFITRIDPAPEDYRGAKVYFEQYLTCLIKLDSRVILYRPLAYSDHLYQEDFEQSIKEELIVHRIDDTGVTVQRKVGG